MFNNRTPHVDVNRVELNGILDAIRSTHAKEYAYEIAKQDDFGDLTLQKSKTCIADYTKVINMLDVSVDDTIQLDNDTPRAFRAFYKGVWGWSDSFMSATTSFKNYIDVVSRPKSKLAISMKFDKIVLPVGNRMVRIGAGQHKGKWFIRVDLWWVGIRLAKK